jgi:hypothetical protein
MDKELTQSAQQTIKFFEEFIRRDTVTEFIKKYRQYLNLPPNGLVLTKEDQDELGNRLGLPHFYLPKRAKEKFPKDEREKPFRVVNTCLAFTGQQRVRLWSVALMLLHYLFFNRITDIPIKLLGIGTGGDDLIRLNHLPSELSWFDSEDHFLLKCMYDHFENISKTHPIVLYLNPEASQRQIQEFLARNWVFVEKYKKEVKNPITGFRKKDPKKRERNDFIYANRNLPRSKIVSMVIKKFGDAPDEGAIGKIISLEKKKREKK